MMSPCCHLAAAHTLSPSQGGKSSSQFTEMEAAAAAWAAFVRVFGVRRTRSLPEALRAEGLEACPCSKYMAS